MLTRKKNKTKTGTDLSSPEESIGLSITPLEMGSEAEQRLSPFRGDPLAQGKHVSEPQQVSADGLDADLILTYLAYDHLFELALVRAGFVAASGTYRQVRPDWYRWARHIEKQFDPDSSPELQAAAAYLQTLQNEMEEHPGRLQNRIQWESSSPFSDILWLADMLQQIRILLTHRYNVVGISGCDTALVMAALMIMEEWLQLVPA